MRVLIIIGFAIALESTSAALLGSNRCTWGPSYWCRHLGTMKECSSTGYCSRRLLGSGSRGSSGGVSPPASADCSFCRLLASDLRRLTLSGNRTGAAEQQRATAACGLVPEARPRALCLAIVANYFNEAAALLKAGLNPDQLCTALTLCGASSVSEERDPKLSQALEDLDSAATATTTAPPLARVPLGVLVHGAPLPDPALAAQAERLNGGFCDLCVDLVAAVKQAAESSATEAEVASAVKSAVCARLSEGSRGLCNIWVDEYVPQAMRMLAERLNPRQICVNIKFCPATAKFHSHPVMQLMLLQRSASKPLKDVECEVCEKLVSEARQMLRDNRTQEEIIEFIKNRVCSLVPAEKDKCIRAVTEYGPIIFQLLASELDPNGVCQALGACGKQQRQPRRPRVGPQCMLCEYIVRELEKLIGDNRTKASIEYALESVCSVMPSTLRAECDAWVKKYTPLLLRLLSQEVSPEMICSVMGLCASQTAHGNNLRSKPFNSATGCDVCQTVILYVKSLLKENATEQEVEEVLEKVCNFLPTQEQKACQDFVKQYTPYIIQLLLQDVDAKQICQTIGLCPKATSRRPSWQQQLLFRPPGGSVVEMRRQGRGEPIV